MAVTRLSGGLTPANGSDPRTFPAIWNATADDIEQAETDIAAIEANDWVTTARIDDGAVTAPKLATTAGAVMVFADAAARTAAIPTPSEGMITYLEDTNAVEKYDGSAFVNVDTGKILQVVQVVKDDTFSTSSSSAVDVTGLSATITPIATSSKVLVLLDVAWSMSATANRAIRPILTDGSNNDLMPAASGTSYILHQYQHSFTTNMARFSAVKLHSPNTTSAFTYKLRVSVDGDTGYINRNGSNTVFAQSTITVMEVAG
jgi:hypothetical protein